MRTRRWATQSTRRQTQPSLFDIETSGRLRREGIALDDIALPKGVLDRIDRRWMATFSQAPFCQPSSTLGDDPLRSPRVRRLRGVLWEPKGWKRAGTDLTLENRLQPPKLGSSEVVHCSRSAVSARTRYGTSARSGLRSYFRARRSAAVSRSLSPSQRASSASIRLSIASRSAPKVSDRSSCSRRAVSIARGARLRSGD